MRNRRVYVSPQTPLPSLAPGELVRIWAKRKGWDLVNCNIMFEGTTDVAYCRVADRLYYQKHKLKLLDYEFQVFAIGEGSEGGTEGIKERLRSLQEMLRDEPEGSPIRVICVLDDDSAGRGTFNLLKRKFRPWVDIFRLQRRTPRTTRDPGAFEKKWLEENASWAGLDCDIEDLFSRDLLALFVSENQGCEREALKELGGAHHFKFHGFQKARLARFADDRASYDDVLNLIEMLRSFRWLLGLGADGS